MVSCNVPRVTCLRVCLGAPARWCASASCLGTGTGGHVFYEKTNTRRILKSAVVVVLLSNCMTPLLRSPRAFSARCVGALREWGKDSGARKHGRRPSLSCVGMIVADKVWA